MVNAALTRYRLDLANVGSQGPKTRFGRCVPMQSGSSSIPSGVSSHSTLLGELVRRQIRFVIGLAILAGLMLAIAALATWNVTDPSFSNANGAVPQNALGFSGAAFADLVMQFFGLAGLIGLLPALFWAIGLLRNRPVDRASRRAAAWFGGAWLTAALFGLMPRSDTWPLPNGLGGVLGDMALKLPSVFTGGFPSGLVAVILGVLIAPVACWLLVFGAGLIGRPVIAEETTNRLSKMTTKIDEASSGSLILGAVTHGWYTTRARLRRMVGLADLRRLRPMPDSPLDLNRAYDPADDVFQDGPRRPAGERIEPGFAASTQGRPQHVDDAPPFDIDDEPLPEGILSDDLDQEDDPAADWRPQPAPVRCRPKRLNRMPRMLEGVLEDFGVKGEIIHVRPGPVVTLYELEPAPGIKSSRVIGLADDIARSMSAIAARVAVVPGRNAIGIELPNAKRETVYLRELIGLADLRQLQGQAAAGAGQDHRRRAGDRRSGQACRTCWSRAPPARASRWRSTP
jgi:S-DNA-T family DNA segregation ATPase FtsK/SpoIIIE